MPADPQALWGKSRGVVFNGVVIHGLLCYKRKQNGIKFHFPCNIVRKGFYREDSQMELGTFVVVEHRGHPLNRLVGKIVGKRGEYMPGDLWCLVFVLNRGRSYLIPESMLRKKEDKSDLKKSYLVS